MRKSWKGLVLAVVAATTCVVAGVPSSVSGQGQDANAIYVYRVAAGRDANATATDLSARGFDLVEGRDPHGDLLVIGDADTAAKLKQAGFRARVSEQLPSASDQASTVGAARFAGNYPDPAEQYAHLDAVAAAYPGLAQVFDYGDSYLKTQGLGGNDLKAICLTNRQPGDCVLSPNSTKPRFVIMAQIHAREITTGELMYRWIDELTSNYNVDPDITVLLDSTEVWIVPVVNPDGVDIVKQGGNAPYLQRKNAHPGGGCANPPTVSNQAGVDLNRNSSFKYGGAGTSTALCDQTYKGTGASSEPETSALQAFFAQLFPDTRGPLDTDVAPETTRDMFVTVHSYSNFVLLPWSWTNGNAPNNTALRHLAFRMSYFNNYQTGRGGEILYTASGVTDDYVYGTFGVPGFTFEIGPTSGTCSGFTPAYSCQDSTFWPLNKPAFLQGAKMAREPYTLSRGPMTRSVALSAGAVVQGTSSTLTATADDNALGNAAGSFGRPTRQNVNRVEYCVDVAPWAGCTPVAMTAADGSFNSVTENATVSVPTGALTVGRHTIYVRSRDTSNYWGAYSAIFLTVT